MLGGSGLLPSTAVHCNMAKLKHPKWQASQLRSTCLVYHTQEQNAIHVLCMRIKTCWTKKTDEWLNGLKRWRKITLATSYMGHDITPTPNQALLFSGNLQPLPSICLHLIPPIWVICTWKNIHETPNSWRVGSNDFPLKWMSFRFLSPLVFRVMKWSSPYQVGF